MKIVNICSFWLVGVCYVILTFLYFIKTFLYLFSLKKKLGKKLETIAKYLNNRLVIDFFLLHFFSVFPKFL